MTDCPKCEDVLWMAATGEDKANAARRIGWADPCSIDNHLDRHGIEMPAVWRIGSGGRR